MEQGGGTLLSHKSLCGLYRVYVTSCPNLSVDSDYQARAEGAMDPIHVSCFSVSWDSPLSLSSFAQFKKTKTTMSIGPCKLMTRVGRHLRPWNLGVSGGQQRHTPCLFLCHRHCERTPDVTLVIVDVIICLGTSLSSLRVGTTKDPSTCVFTP